MNYKNNLYVFFCLLSFTFFAQTKKINTLKSFSICEIDKKTKKLENCRNEIGQIVFNKVEVIPEKTITLYMTDNDKQITANWDSSKFSLNNSNDLFIYL